jgi:glutamyl-tRNA reductase
MELGECCYQASKKIKTDTEISSGATSVSFAAVRYIINNVQDIGNKHSLVWYWKNW